MLIQFLVMNVMAVITLITVCHVLRAYFLYDLTLTLDPF